MRQVNIHILKMRLVIIPSEHAYYTHISTSNSTNLTIAPVHSSIQAAG